MLRFEQFEQLGVRFAGMSDIADGDCGHRTGGGEEGRARVAATCGYDAERLVWGWQVHGTRVQLVEQAHLAQVPFPDTDGVATRLAGTPLGVFVADCVPIFLFVPRTGSAAVVHAGREGTRHGIVAEAAKILAAAHGVQSKEIHALIGPSAGPCCYEVSPELAADFSGAGLPTRARHLDLWEANALQLTALGVQRTNIVIASICTICTGRFFSHRRDATGGRNLAVLMV